MRKNARKRLYGSQLIVNDEEKSKQNSPRMKTSSSVILPSIHSNNYTVIAKQRKVSYAWMFIS